MWVILTTTLRYCGVLFSYLYTSVGTIFLYRALRALVMNNSKEHQQEFYRCLCELQPSEPIQMRDDVALRAIQAYKNAALRLVRVLALCVVVIWLLPSVVLGRYGWWYGYIITPNLERETELALIVNILLAYHAYTARDVLAAIRHKGENVGAGGGGGGDGGGHGDRGDMQSDRRSVDGFGKLQQVLETLTSPIFVHCTLVVCCTVAWSDARDSFLHQICVAFAAADLLLLGAGCAMTLAQTRTIYARIHKRDDVNVSNMKRADGHEKHHDAITVVQRENGRIRGSSNGHGYGGGGGGGRGNGTVHAMSQTCNKIASEANVVDEWEARGLIIRKAVQVYEYVLLDLFPLMIRIAPGMISVIAHNHALHAGPLILAAVASVVHVHNVQSIRGECEADVALTKTLVGSMVGINNTRDVNSDRDVSREMVVRTKLLHQFSLMDLFLPTRLFNDDANGELEVWLAQQRDFMSRRQSEASIASSLRPPSFLLPPPPPSANQNRHGERTSASVPKGTFQSATTTTTTTTTSHDTSPPGLLSPSPTRTHPKSVRSSLQRPNVEKNARLQTEHGTSNSQPSLFGVSATHHNRGDSASVSYVPPPLPQSPFGGEYFRTNSTSMPRMVFGDMPPSDPSQFNGTDSVHANSKESCDEADDNENKKGDNISGSGNHNDNENMNGSGESATSTNLLDVVGVGEADDTRTTFFASSSSSSFSASSLGPVSTESRRKRGKSRNRG